MTDPAGIRWESLATIVGALALAVWALRDPDSAKQAPPAREGHLARFKVQLKNQPARLVDVLDGARLGRSGDCDIVLDNSTVSKHHARVRIDERAWLYDSESTNGTYVNGRRIAVSTPLRRGDRIALGTAKLVFLGLAPRGSNGSKG